MTRHNTKKLRAVFLAALMVLWVFAGTVAFVGGAAASHDTDADETIDPADQIDNVNSGTYYQGQELELNLTDTSNVGSEVQVRRVTSRSDTGAPTNTNLETTATVQSSGGHDYVVIRTSNLQSGDYVLQSGGSYLNATNDNFNENLGGAAQFEITTQSLSVEFDDDEVRSDQSTEITIDSNRGDYDLVVSADGLDAEELNNTFDDLIGNGVDSISEDSEDDEITLEGVDSFIDEEDVTFTDIEPDDYDFDFEVDDTTAEDNASITVLEEVDADATFTQSTFTDQRGDLVNVSLEVEGDADDVWVVFGDEEDYGYAAWARFEPNDDDEVVFQFNTFKAGNASGQVAPDEVDEQVFIEDEGDIQEANSTVMRDGDGTNDNLNRVLEDGTYEMNVSVVSGGDTEETDVSVVNLQERSLNGVSIGTAPSAETIDELEDLETGAEEGWITQTDEIAIEDGDEGSLSNSDKAIVQLEMSGLMGFFAGSNGLPEDDVSDDFFNTLGQGQFEGIVFDAEQTNPTANQDPKELNMSDNAEVYADGDENVLYVVLDTNTLEADGGELETGDSYEPQVELDEDTFLQLYYREDNIDDNETISSEFEFVERDATFDTNADDEVEVTNDESAEVTGTTNVAPGTELTLRATRSGDGAFLRTADAEVSEDGSFNGTFEDGDSFSDIEPDTTFDMEIRQQSFEDDVETDGRVVEAMEEETPTPTPGEETPTPTEAEETPTPTEAEETPTEAEETPTEEPSDDQAGFGAVIALIALLGAALLAARRNDF